MTMLIMGLFAEELEMAQLDSKQYLAKMASLEGQFCSVISNELQFCGAVLVPSGFVQFCFAFH